MSDWMRETLHPDYAQALRVGRVLYDSQTDHQRLSVVLGKVGDLVIFNLIVDGGQMPVVLANRFGDPLFAHLPNFILHGLQEHLLQAR